MVTSIEDNAPEDRELILRLQSGDLEALGALYDRYRLQIFRTALAVTQDASAAEDILQECFLRVHAYSHRIDASLPLSPWLYRVTVNLSYTWTKRHNRNRVSLEGFIDRLIAPSGHAPDISAERSELVERMQDAIDALPFSQRVVIILHYLNGLNLQEIAEVLDCPVGTVKSRLYHARENLRDQLGPGAKFPDVAHGYT